MKAAKEKTFFLLVLIATALLSCATATASSTHVLGPENRAEKIFLGGLDRVEQSPLGPANHVEFGTELRTTALGSPVAPSPGAVVDKSYKLKIQGTAQRTGTPGHQFRMYREAITEAKKPNVTSVHLDHGYNRALNLDPKTISPNRRPDVVSIYDNRSVLRVEVQSKTDLPAVLRSRNSALDQQLIDQGFTPLPPRVVRPTSPSVNFRQ